MLRQTLVKLVLVIRFQISSLMSTVVPSIATAALLTGISSLPYLSTVAEPVTYNSHICMLEDDFTTSSSDLSNKILYCYIALIASASGDCYTGSRISKSKILEIPISAASYGALQNFILWNGFCQTLSQQAEGN